MLPNRTINVWPVSNRGGLKALAEITLADAVTIFPIKLVEGKHGLYLKMPRSTKDTDKDQLTYNICSWKARAQLTEEVVKTYHVEQPWLLAFGDNEPIRLKYIVHPNIRNENQEVASASIEINESIRVNGIRMFQLSEKVRLVTFPDRCYREDDEYCFRRIFDFKNDWEKRITAELWEAYDSLKMRRR